MRRSSWKLLRYHFCSGRRNGSEITIHFSAVSKKAKKDHFVDERQVKRVIFGRIDGENTQVGSQAFRTRRRAETAKVHKNSGVRSARQRKASCLKRHRLSMKQCCRGVKEEQHGRKVATTAKKERNILKLRQKN